MQEKAVTRASMCALCASVVVAFGIAALGGCGSPSATVPEDGGSTSGGGSGSSGGSSGTSSSGTSSSGTSGSGGSGSSSGGGTSTSSSGSASGSGGSSSGSGSSSSSGSTSGGFRHPGVLVNSEQLTFLKGRIASGAAPWTAALQEAKTRLPPSYLGTVPFASLTYVPQPVPQICCGSRTTPDVGCRAEQFDVAAAYTDALIWALSGDESYAKQSIAILNAYGSVLQTHAPPTTMCGTPPGLSSNTPVQSGWTGSVFPRAAEIMRATYPPWAQADIDKFKAMLRSAYLPNLINGAIHDNGNWELSIADALIQIGVFLDDQATYNQGLTYWRRRVPAYIYLTTDGAMPVTIPGQGATWNGATSYFNGLSQETCRDLGHVQLAFAAMINGAETARIQGVDLYSEQGPRIVAGLELAASYLNGATTPDPGCPYNAGMAMGFPNPPLNKPNPTWEIAYNQYATRAAMMLPNTAALVAKVRPTTVDHEMVWETLTHAEVGSVGLP